MNDFKDSSMIALLPTTSDWCRIPLPHMTLVYVGKIEELSPTLYNEMAKTALSLSVMNASLTLPVIWPDVLGDEEKVDVLLLQTKPRLMAMRKMVEQWNASQFDFQPHVTVGPVGSINMNYEFPYSITFDRIMVAWGNENLTYRLRSDEDWS